MVVLLTEGSLVNMAVDVLNLKKQREIQKETQLRSKRGQGGNKDQRTEKAVTGGKSQRA